MKLVHGFCCTSLFFFVAFAAEADNGQIQQNTQQIENSTSAIAQYILYLGGYLGYDLRQSPTANHGNMSQELLSLSTTQLAENYVYSTFFGALPVAAIGSTFNEIVPNTIPGSNVINKLANSAYTYQGYSNPSGSQQGHISISPLIDQQNYQQDPVSQAVLNILGTPDYTYCMSYDQSTWNSNCNYLYENLVMSNVVGTLPNSAEFFSYDYNQQLIGQLNANALMGTLQFSNQNSNQNNTGSPTPKNQNVGLIAQNPIQQAANFIRYVSGAVAPTPLPQQSAYQDLYNQAMPVSGSKITPIQQMEAQATLSNYLTSLRVYAAQSSVGVSNLYYILSKRLPQNQSGESNNSLLTSQAMSEFTMASWRLYNPDMTQNKQWLTQLNTASAATVEKEIATLLAEINYQMYLQRQIQERLLLTNSVMLIENTRAAQPSPDFSNQAATSNSTNSNK